MDLDSTPAGLLRQLGRVDPRAGLDELADALLARCLHGVGGNPDDPLRGLDVDDAADLLGQVYESSLESAHRQAGGIHYTPPTVADGLLALVPDHVLAPPARPRICDPAAGGGAFLLAAARRLRALGHDPAAIIDHMVTGFELDPIAAQVASRSLQIWAAAEGVRSARPGSVVVADVLVAPPLPPGQHFDLVVGNPPFQGQLRSRSTRSRTDAAALKSRFGAAATAYTDTSILFVLAALEWVRVGGHVSMILPVTALSTRDTEVARHQILESADLDHLWLARERVFSAEVRVWAPLLRRLDPADADDDGRGAGRDGGVEREIRRSVLPTFVAARPVAARRSELRSAATWGWLVSDLLGIPACPLETGGTLGDWCSATAGFRDEYYGLVGAVREAGPARGGDPMLITSGLIEPGWCLWAERPARFAKQRWDAPVVHMATLAGNHERVARWTEQRLRPKVLLAAQTRVLEAVVDTQGTMVPSVPVISVEPHDAEMVWSIAAVLLAPPVSVWALTRFVGGALSGDAIKLSARQVLDLPRPPVGTDLSDAIAELRAVAGADDVTRYEHLDRFGALMCEAYRVGPASTTTLLAWWSERLPGPK